MTLCTGQQSYRFACRGTSSMNSWLHWKDHNLWLYEGRSQATISCTLICSFQLAGIRFFLWELIACRHLSESTFLLTSCRRVASAAWTQTHAALPGQGFCLNPQFFFWNKWIHNFSRAGAGMFLAVSRSAFNGGYNQSRFCDFWFHYILLDKIPH